MAVVHSSLAWWPRTQSRSAPPPGTAASVPTPRWCQRRSSNRDRPHAAEQFGPECPAPPHRVHRTGPSAGNSPVSAPGSLTASVKMARISASIERPCLAARSRSRSFTPSSRFRILTADTAITSRVLSMLASPANKAGAHSRGRSSTPRMCELSARRDRAAGDSSRLTAADGATLMLHGRGPAVEVPTRTSPLWQAVHDRLSSGRPMSRVRVGTQQFVAGHGRRPAVGSQCGHGGFRG